MNLGAVLFGNVCIDSSWDSSLLVGPEGSVLVVAIMESNFDVQIC